MKHCDICDEPADGRDEDHEEGTFASMLDGMTRCWPCRCRLFLGDDADEYMAGSWLEASSGKMSAAQRAHFERLHDLYEETQAQWEHGLLEEDQYE